MTQEQLFDTGDPPPSPQVTAPAPTVGTPVPRKPGWVLIASIQGPVGFHKVYGSGKTGSLVTVCGVVGRKVDDSQTSIIECPICAAS